MTLREMLVLACSLAMNTFAVSLLLGSGTHILLRGLLAPRRKCVLDLRESILRRKQIFWVSLIFALVQGSVIAIAWQIGSRVSSLAGGFTHWSAFAHWGASILLAGAAIHMLREGKAKIYAPPVQSGEQNTEAGNAPCPECDLPGEKAGENNQAALLPASLLTLLGLAAAPGCDSLMAGAGVALLGRADWLFPLLVFGITFLFSVCGMFLGRRARNAVRLGGWACIAGAMMLLSLALDILRDYGVFG